MSESLGIPATWAEVRAALAGKDRNAYVNVNVPAFVLIDLLDAADERDRLAAQVERVRALADEPIWDGDMSAFDVLRALDGADDE